MLTQQVNIIYNNGNGYYYWTNTWNGGFLWLTKYQDDYYMTHSYNRCLTYYHDNWIANQGQTIGITSTKTVNRSVTDGVTAEVGVSDVVSSKVSTTHTTSVSTAYSTALSITYNLSQFSKSSYKIAAMGFYDRFKINRFANNSYEYTYYRYAYDKNYGQEIRLVYRY